MSISQNLNVKDVMTRGVITMSLNTSVKDIAKIIVESHVHGVCVTDEFGEIAGIVSEMDIIKAFNRDINKVTAEEIMSDKVVTISGEDYVEKAVDVMVKRKIHRILVVLGEDRKDSVLSLPKRPVGILSLTDVIKLMAKD
ncbi:Inosine-5'-monophosphate dehydrogenase [groundwater metagenome]|uniref:Inosine-5'-monophosphate dehydrogenase n=1 Tax=groundwater metagenome TaxID=717931 RepID=A0A098E7H7_9ZZZZ